MLLLELKMNQAQHQQQQQSGTTLLYTAEGQPVTITLPPQTSPYQAYDSGQSKISGLILIVVGVLSIVLNGIGYGVHEVGTISGYAFGSGIMVSKLSRFRLEGNLFFVNAGLPQV